ncbi:MAG: 2-oxo acid dehydrogenase subunit E2 [Nitrospinota bacterium]|nr:MAG: 2-oxo acid dehydrogenase subunit E2 [Nitrospinota bacterium]
MAFEFRFPDVGEGIVEGEIVRVLVQEGEKVRLDQPLFEVETDKAVVTIPSPRAGTIREIAVREGEIIKVGQTMVVIEEVEAATSSATVVGALEEAPPVEEPSAPPSRARGKGERRILAIPSVRKLAAELGVDLAGIEGTGSGGRITREDVLRAAERQKAVAVSPEPAPTAREEIEIVPLRRLRRTIAQAMVKSKATIPHVTGTDEVDVTLLSEVRDRAREVAQQQGIRLTFLPFLIKAVVAGLIRHPFLNASLDEEKEEIILKKFYHIGVATHTEEGLIVPVIKNADQKSILQLAREVEELSQKARERTIDFADLHGGTFTITNYGAVGGIFGTPIIRHPEVAILGVGKMLEKPVVHQGAVVVRKILPLSLSFDHRVIDGVVAQRFLNTVMERLENPYQLLLEL